MCGSPNSGGYEIMSPRQGLGHGAPMTIGLAAVAVIGFKITATTATLRTGFDDAPACLNNKKTCLNNKKCFSGGRLPVQCGQILLLL